MRSERRTRYCSPSGSCRLPFGWSGNSFGLGTSCGHASTATHRLRTSAAVSGTSCRHAYSTDRQLAPPAGQHLAPSRRICAHSKAEPW